MRPVLILGGYGNFGKRIARALVKAEVKVIIAGRSSAKAEALQNELGRQLADVACFDAFRELDLALDTLKPKVVINTCGPFQTSDYAIAEGCIRHGVHYIDLADGRAFVAGITALDQQAKDKNIAVISGASTVPGLSSAVLEHFKDEFAEIDELKFGISPGQQAERGLATTQAILTYVGRPLEPFAGHKRTVYGWQNIYRQKYPELGQRWMANCDIPDLDLLPARYGIKSIQFSAGLELGFLHLGLWGLSWLVRIGFPLDLQRYAKTLLKASTWFNLIGSADGAMHMIMSGKDYQGQPYRRSWFIIAVNSHGPHIPTIPSILLAKKIVKDKTIDPGAYPCIGLVSLEDYLNALSDYEIKSYSFRF